MGNNLKLCLSFLLFFFFVSFATTSSPSSFNRTIHKCSEEQRDVLLHFKENISSISETTQYYQYMLSLGCYPIMRNWKKSIDCCNWNGVTCDHFTDDVIGLDLSCGMIQGTFHPNTTLFQLPRLQRLNLAYNDFYGSKLPHEIKRFSNSLTHLNISNSGFTGQIPPDVTFLSKLVSLDLSLNDGFEIQPYVMNNLLQNTTHLRELVMSYVNMSGLVLPTYVNISSSLKTLDLSTTGLQGKFPENIFYLPCLEKLILSYNMLNGTLPSFLFTLPFLRNIYLSGNMFSGGLPTEFFNHRSLRELELSFNQFDGEINGRSTSTPPSFIQLSNLIFVDLSHNNFKGLWDLDTLFLSLPNLTHLDLSYNGFSVVTNNSTANAYANPQFRLLGLASCMLNVFPQSIRTMKVLRYLDLSGNNMGGRVPDWAGEIGRNSLSYLNLSHNSITGLPQFQWDRLYELYFQSNEIHGPFPSSICNMSYLQFLDMSNNRFGGVIPQCLGNIIYLSMINLGSNHFHGTIPNMCKDNEHLEGILLNENRLEGEIPTSFSNCSLLKVLDLGNNHLNGTFPGLLGDLPSLQVLVLKSNNLHGSIDAFSKTEFPFPLLQVLDLSNNRLRGHLPRKYFRNFDAMKDFEREGPKSDYLRVGNSYYSIVVVVKGSQLSFQKISVEYTIIDLSNNIFEGEIPSIIGSLNSLIVLNLSHNNLNGRIPHDLGNLTEIESLDLSWNRLTGEIPQSLAGITNLEVLRLAQNNLVGRIPEGKQFNTFDQSSYLGNPKLCGLPLPKHCERPSSPPLVEEDEDEDEDESLIQWKVVMLGYGCGTLLGLVMGYVMLSTGRPKWYNSIADVGERMIQTKQKKRRYIIYIGK